MSGLSWKHAVGNGAMCQNQMVDNKPTIFHLILLLQHGDLLFVIGWITGIHTMV